MRKTKTSNKFLQSLHSKDTYTANGALSNSSTGSALVDQFGSAGSHRGRSFTEVSKDMSRIYGEDKLSALQFTYYLRLITRKIKGSFVTDTVQLGQGNRDESFKRLLWVAQNDPKVFYANLWLLPIVGSWKDLWSLMILGSDLGVKLDRNQFYELIAQAIKDDNERPLVQKFLPQVKASSKCTTPRAKALNAIAKGFVDYVGWTPKEYRKFKSTGEAHVFQRVLCGRLYKDIKWNQIPGRALSLLVKGKFLAKHGLEDSYTKWIMTQPAAKFTGYVHELGAQVKSARTQAQIMTLDKQFVGVLKNNNPMIENGRRVISAIDRSGSMDNLVAGGSTTAMNVAESLGVYFANLLPGAFNGWVIRFSSRSEWVKLTGSFTQQMRQMTWGDCPSNTDFQSIIDSFVTMKRRHPSIPESDFPNTLLVVSDMQFDAPSWGYNQNHAGRHDVKTNYQVAIKKLKAAGFSQAFVDDFQFIWWNVRSNTNDYPQTLNEPGGYFISGFDGAIISLIVNGEKIKDEKTGKLREKTMEEKMNDALNQEILQQVAI
jgi:hypothetical protein